MSWVYKPSKSPYYYAAWRDLDGRLRQRSTRTKDKAVARQRARQFEREHEAASRAPTITLEEALMELRDHKVRGERSVVTIEILECKGGHLLRLLGRHRMLDAITIRDTEQYLDKRKTEGASNHTIDKELSVLVQCLRRAQHLGLYHSAPKAVWPSMLRDTYTPRNRYYTREEFRRALLAMVPSRRDHFLVYCHTGLRHSELHAIEAQHVDHRLRRLHVPGTKTAAAGRVIDLTTEAYLALAARADEYPEGPLFPDVWHRSRIVKDLAKVHRRAGLAPARVKGEPLEPPDPRLPASCNDFRRTFATWCADAGIAEMTVVRWLGHSSSRMIRKVYQQLSESRGREEVQRLDQLVAPRKAPVRGGNNGGNARGSDQGHSGAHDAAKTPRK